MSVSKQLTPAQKWVIGLTILALALALRNFGRSIIALRYAARLPDLSTTVPLSYLTAMGGFWGSVFMVCAIGLAGFRDWGRWCTLMAVTLYQTNVWVNHILFNASEYGRRATPRNLVLTAILLAVFWGSLNVPPVRRVFGRNERRR